ncbi:hypothetical protein ACLB6G_18400 [Zhengella sp. ZM62]|uniref:hypothetical protein n=1 Tax=Zhengella sedimenti TaxID=3390035 RepID=UPI0039752AAE
MSGSERLKKVSRRSSAFIEQGAGAAADSVCQFAPGFELAQFFKQEMKQFRRFRPVARPIIQDRVECCRSLPVELDDGHFIVAADC